MIAVRPLTAFFFAAAVCAATPAAAKGPAAKAGKLTPEPATLHSLGVRWIVQDDDNGNATVAVAYRAAGEPAWREALPLFRTSRVHLSPENQPQGTQFAGSVVELRPGTRYEVRLTLADPDGGGETRNLEMATRAEPALPPPARTVQVRPDGAAAAIAAARPGDALVFAPGTYRLPGVVPPSGAPGQPIVFRAAPGGPVVFDGGGAEYGVNATGRRHLWFEGITFRNARRLVRLNNASEIVFRRNAFEVTLLGINGEGAVHDESVGIFVLDNTFTGNATWPRSKGIEQVYAVNLTGSGHVVAYNRMTNVGDAVHNGSNGRISATDYHNNDVMVCTDDGIETDHAETNIRVFRNRITNCFAGISFQPVFGGPVYVWRNVIFNTEYTPFKLHNQPSGVLLFHNTTARRGSPFVIQPGGDPVSDVVTRNNLFVGSGSPAIVARDAMIRTDFDNDGYAWGLGGFADWVGRAYPSPLAAKQSGQLYAKFGAISLQPGRDTGIKAPADPGRRFEVTDYDPRLSAGARAIDRGVRIPNFNDTFSGAAPDLGCCELGEPLPHYGPRER